MIQKPERLISFERCFNFRDLGGYAGRDGRTIRWRRLFRSMTPQYMSEVDAEAVSVLGIGLVIDFRGAHYDSSGPVVSSSCARLPLSPQFVQRTDEEYERFRLASPAEALPKLLENYGEQFGSALTAIAERPDTPALFHCRLGKDRTGVFAALVLKLLGVCDDVVTQDYLLTTHHEPRCRELLDATEADASLTAREPRVAREPPSRAAIAGVLERLVSQYGGAHGYFSHNGVSAANLQAFIDNMLESPAGVGDARQDEAIAAG